MDVTSIQRRLDAGERLKIKYRYPEESDGSSFGTKYGVRTDRLMDISVDLKRFYARFRGITPIWLEEQEVLEVMPDDGKYDDYPAE